MWRDNSRSNRTNNKQTTGRVPEGSKQFDEKKKRGGLPCKKATKKKVRYWVFWLNISILAKVEREGGRGLGLTHSRIFNRKIP